jgi:hypothetical protein
VAGGAGECGREGGEEGVGLVLVAEVVGVEEVRGELAAPGWADVAGDFCDGQAAFGG